jgi:hypothetical protein
MGSAPAGFEGAPEGSSCLEGDDSRLTDSFATSHAKTFGGGDSPRRNLSEFVRLLIVPVGDVIELDVVVLVLEGPYNIAIGLHLVIMATCILHDLVNHEL